MTEPDNGLRYSDAGVNIDAATDALRQVKDTVKKTFSDRVLTDIGAFGALYEPDLGGLERPVLVSSVDGVGTKLKLAFMTNKHDTVGVDLVAHCVNDILVQGARPLFFLDYLAFGKLEPQVMVDVVTGLATGCRYAGCALIGGETAEMPGMYAEGEYDLAGAIVGLADKDKIVDGSSITEGDVVIGLASSGLHTNGYSLARKVCFDLEGLRPDDAMPGTGKTVAEALMEPHRSYAKIVGVLTRSVPVHGMVHVTGGGVTDNLPRVLPGGLEAQIDLTAWRAPRIFQFLSAKGRVSQTEMLRTFNCGVGYIVIVPEGGLDKALHVLNQTGEKASVIGRIAEGEGGVRYQGELAYA